MAFPFTIKYSKSFDRKLKEDEIVQALFYIQGFIRDKSADKIEILNDCIIYKGSKAAYNWNIFQTVDKGIFKMDGNGTSVITYEISMYHLWIFVSIAAIVFFIVSKSYLAPLLCLGWLGGMNWLITFIRHGGMFDEIKDGIDTLLVTTRQSPPIEMS